MKMMAINQKTNKLPGFISMKSGSDKPINKIITDYIKSGGKEEDLSRDDNNNLGNDADEINASTFDLLIKHKWVKTIPKVFNRYRSSADETLTGYTTKLIEAGMYELLTEMPHVLSPDSIEAVMKQPVKSKALCEKLLTDTISNTDLGYGTNPNTVKACKVFKKFKDLPEYTTAILINEDVSDKLFLELFTPENIAKLTDEELTQVMSNVVTKRLEENRFKVEEVK
jgi:hypothetical protein